MTLQHSDYILFIQAFASLSNYNSSSFSFTSFVNLIVLVSVRWSSFLYSVFTDHDSLQATQTPRITTYNLSFVSDNLVSVTCWIGLCCRTLTWYWLISLFTDHLHDWSWYQGMGCCCQGAMKATFKAINNSPTPVLAPVGMSHLAQRRGKNFMKIDTKV